MLSWKAWKYPHESPGFLLRLHAQWFSWESMDFPHEFSVVFPWMSRDGGEDQHRARKVYELSKACLEKGGFNLRKWRTSDQELQSLIYEIQTKQQTPKAETKF